MNFSILCAKQNIFPRHIFSLHDTFIFPLRNEKQFLSDFLLLYHNKLQEQKVQDVANKNKTKLEPYDDLVDSGFFKVNEKSIYNQNPHRQIEIDKTPEAKYPNENDSEDTEINKSSAYPNVIPQVLTDDEIARAINFLNSAQREVFNAVHMCVKII